MRSPINGRRLVALLIPAAVLVLGACASSGAGDEPPAAPTAIVGQTEFDFPTGPASVVPAGYRAPVDYVPSTGAFLPVNGKPTLVFVDAIW